MLPSLFLRWCLRIAAVLLAWAGVALSAYAQAGLQPVPALGAHVIDLTGTLNAAQQHALDAKLAAFETAHGSQVVVLVVSSTAPEDIASYANRVGNAWKIGRKDIGDGLLLLVAKDDHKLRIEVAKSLEGAIPDLAAKRVIDQQIAPRFKQGDFAGGLDAGADQIMALIQHEALPEPALVPVGSNTWQEVGFVDFLVLALFVKLGGPAGAAAVLLSSAVGAVFGTVAWLVFANGSVTFWSAMAGMVAGFAGLLALGSSKNGSKQSDGTGKAIAASGGEHGWSSRSSGDSGSGSSGGFFGSGGGGDFGGGGASGDW